MSSNLNRYRKAAVPFGAGRSLLTSACLLTTLALGTVALAAARFSITPIVAPGNQVSYPWAVTDPGHVTGSFPTGQHTPGGNVVYHAFVKVNNTVTELPTLAGSSGGATSRADGYGVNKNGDVVGTSQIAPQGAPHAFLYRNGQITDLHPQLGGLTSQANAINDAGQVVGTFGDNPSFGNAFVLQPGQPVIDLGPGVAYAISNTGYVTGETLDNNNNSVPFVFRDANNDREVEPGELVLLKTLGATIDNHGNDVNDTGKVVGVCVDGSGKSHAVLWDSPLATTVPKDLGSLGGANTNSFATGINNSGQIVGVSNAHSFLWESGQMKNLDTLIPTEPGSSVPKWQLVFAAGITNAGQIAGQGVPNNTASITGFLLTAGSTPPPPASDIKIADFSISPSTIYLDTQPILVTTTLTLNKKPKTITTIDLKIKVNGEEIPTTQPLQAKQKKKKGTFKLTFNPDADDNTYEVTATCGGVTKSATLVVKHVALETVSITPSVASMGTKVTASLTLNQPPAAPANGASVKIPVTVMKEGVVKLNLVVELKKNKKTGKMPRSASKAFVVPPLVVPAGNYVVSATYGGVTKTAPLKIQ